MKRSRAGRMEGPVPSEPRGDDDITPIELFRSGLFLDAGGSVDTYKSKWVNFAKLIGRPDWALIDVNNPAACGSFPQIGHRHLMSYLYHGREKHEVPTMRQTVSAVIFYARTHGVPISEDAVADIHLCTFAMSKVHDLRRPRGAIDRILFGNLVDRAKSHGRPELVTFFHVQFGLSCRGPSVMPVITAAAVDLEKKTVNVPRKGTSASKAKDGDTVTVPIMTEECYAHLASAVKAKRGKKDEPLFPSWKMDQVNQFIQDTAADYKWCDKYSWSSHSMRHGGAMTYTEEYLDELRQRGGWKCGNTALHYARLRDQRSDVNPNSREDELGLPVEDRTSEQMTALMLAEAESAAAAPPAQRSRAESAASQGMAAAAEEETEPETGGFGLSIFVAVPEETVSGEAT